MINITLGDNIRKYRSKNNLSLRELADKINNSYKEKKISPSFISNIENDHHTPSLMKLKVISDGLNVKMSDLIKNTKFDYTPISSQNY